MVAQQNVNNVSCNYLHRRKANIVEIKITVSSNTGNSLRYVILLESGPFDTGMFSGGLFYTETLISVVVLIKQFKATKVKMKLMLAVNDEAKMYILENLAL
jgi:hypothetical protein